MTQEDGEGAPESVVGLSKSDAVEALVAADDSRDPETVRAALDHVTEDGVVTREGIDAALAHVSKVVSTPETRAEFAAIALSDAREEAEPVADLGVVQSRLDAFETRLDDVETRTADLGPELQRIVQRRDDSGVYEVADGIRQLTAEANRVHQAADDLLFDLDSFERWLANSDTRFDDLEADVDALATSLDELETTVDVVARAADEGDDSTSTAADDAAVAWFDTNLRHRVVALLLADLGAELADLREWADREDDDAERADAIEKRLADLKAQREALGERLDALARPEWTERFGERLAAFEAAFDEFTPPVDWGEVDATFAEHRTGIENEN